jgi:rubredoxin
MSLQFTCPTCKNHRLEEVMSGVTVVSEIAEISEEGDHTYGEQTNEEGVVSQYQCIHCGYILGQKEGSPIVECDEIAEWVKKNCPQGESA